MGDTQAVIGISGMLLSGPDMYNSLYKWAKTLYPDMSPQDEMGLFRRIQTSSDASLWSILCSVTYAELEGFRDVKLKAYTLHRMAYTHLQALQAIPQGTPKKKSYTLLWKNTFFTIRMARIMTENALMRDKLLDTLDKNKVTDVSIVYNKYEYPIEGPFITYGEGEQDMGEVSEVAEVAEATEEVAHTEPPQEEILACREEIFTLREEVSAYHQEMAGLREEMSALRESHENLFTQLKTVNAIVYNVQNNNDSIQKYSETLFAYYESLSANYLSTNASVHNRLQTLETTSHHLQTAQQETTDYLSVQQNALNSLVEFHNNAVQVALMMNSQPTLPMMPEDVYVAYPKLQHSPYGLM